MTTFAEPLPNHCPPAAAFEPEGLEVFRLLDSTNPTGVDFHSHATKWPEKYGSKCTDWAVSIFTQQSNAEQLKGMPVHVNKLIGKLVLTSNSGKIQRTFRRENHFSWWLYENFDPISVCEVIE